MNTNEIVRPFQIHIPDEEIEELHRRLRHTRWPEPFAGSGWDDGTDGEYLRHLVSYWLSHYNWREREALLNQFNHYQADIDGTTLHFIHARSKAPNAIPLLLMQGWPSSFVQVLDIIPLLTGDQYGRKAAFDVIAVSIPSYPFTSFARQPGMGFARIADLVKKLMVDVLGYQRFAARGSDQGALVQQQMGLKYPQHLVGLHRTGITPFISPLPTDLTEAEKEYQQKVAAWAPQETL